MALKFKWVCDECSREDDLQHVFGMTGRVLIDGEDNQRQGCDLCPDHRLERGKHQPNNCVRVRFWWPGQPEWNEE